MKSRKSQKRASRVTTFTFLASEERQQLEDLAKNEGRSLSGQIRFIIKKELLKKSADATNAA